MAIEIPTLDDILQRTRQAFQTYLPGADATVWPSNVYVSAKVIAGRVWEMMHRLSYIEGQAFPLTATGIYLDRHAQQYGITRRAATQAVGNLIISGGTVGTLIPAGTAYQRADGEQYLTLDDVTIPSNLQTTVAVEAVSVGSVGNLAGSESMTLLSVIAGAPASSLVSTEGLVSGSEVEGDDDLRERLLTRLQTPPRPGSASDYVRWASEISGVTRVWVQSQAFGPGTVGVWFTMDDTYADGIPTAADVAVVQAALDLQVPITANVTVAAPNPEPLPIQVTGLHPFNASVIAAVKAELQDLIKQRAEVSTTSEPFYFRQSWVWQAVSNATGERYHTVALPNVDFLVTAGSLPVYDENFVQIGG